MKLIPVKEYPSHHVAQVLYELLKVRAPEENISHRIMPTWTDHVNFITSNPYEAWYLIEKDPSEYLGTIYLTRNNEIGINLFPKYRGMGYGPQAITKIMELKGKRRYLANINPKNERSKKMFEKLGFVHIQNTYELKI